MRTFLAKPPNDPRRSEAGFMLLEVVISALLVALIAVGTFAGLDAAGRASADERTHAEATKLAQQDEERLRGMTGTELAELAQKGSEARPAVEIGKIKFTVTSSASFVSAEKNALTCETAGGGANYIQTTSSVRWTGLASTRPAVTQSSILSTIATGLLVKVKDQNEEPVAGATVTLTGADTGAQTTPASGCVVFTGLSPGSVTVAVSKSTWVDVNGKSPPTSKTVTVVSERTETSEAQIAEPGAIMATFETYEGGKYVTGVRGDTFVAAQAGIAEPSDFVGGTAGNYELSVTTEKTLFPFAKSKVAEPYTVYAGDCPANAPETVTASGEKLKAREAKVTPNGTVTVNEPLEEPPVKVTVYEGTSGAGKKNLLPSAESAYITNTKCEKQKAQNYPSGVTYKREVNISNGALTQETAHQPYAKELEFCVTARVEGSYYRARVSFENKARGGVTVPAIYLKEHEKSSFKKYTCP
jgi:Tfp pilus assembly protein PilX